LSGFLLDDPSFRFLFFFPEFIGRRLWCIFLNYCRIEVPSMHALLAQLSPAAHCAFWDTFLSAACLVDAVVGVMVNTGPDITCCVVVDFDGVFDAAAVAAAAAAFADAGLTFSPFEDLLFDISLSVCLFPW
jgi:hypothetical protein